MRLAMMANSKPRPNHQTYIGILRRMTPEQRLLKAMELTELGRKLLLEGLRRRHPGIGKAELHRLYLQRLEKCHNRNY